jgi:hypothetical protein
MRRTESTADQRAADRLARRKQRRPYTAQPTKTLRSRDTIRHQENAS